MVYKCAAGVCGGVGVPVGLAVFKIVEGRVFSSLMSSTLIHLRHPQTGPFAVGREPFAPKTSKLLGPGLRLSQPAHRVNTTSLDSAGTEGLDVVGLEQPLDQILEEPDQDEAMSGGQRQVAR
jgi:hypothetical protein